MFLKKFQKNSLINIKSKILSSSSLLNTGRMINSNLLKIRFSTQEGEQLAKTQSTTIIKAKEFQNLTPEEKSKMKEFVISRFNPEEADPKKHFVSYYINLKECGPMVLDALIKIKDEMDHTLTFRRSCREGICGSCSMNIDGRNTLACLSYIDNDINRSTFISPLPYFSVLKDLVVDMTNFYMQYKAINPVLLRKTPKVILNNILLKYILERRTKGVLSK